MSKRVEEKRRDYSTLYFEWNLFILKFRIREHTKTKFASSFFNFQIKIIFFYFWNLFNYFKTKVEFRERSPNLFSFPVKEKTLLFLILFLFNKKPESRQNSSFTSTVSWPYLQWRQHHCVPNRGGTLLWAHSFGYD